MVDRVEVDAEYSSPGLAVGATITPIRRQNLERVTDVRSTFIEHPWHFYFMRGHSLVELAKNDSSTADIIVHSMYIYVLLHS